MRLDPYKICTGFLCIKKARRAIIVYMKTRTLFNKICAFVFSFFIFCTPLIFCGCDDNNTYKGELLRLHIRANSNSSVDQAVKLKVLDAVNAYLAENISAAVN